MKAAAPIIVLLAVFVPAAPAGAQLTTETKPQAVPSQPNDALTAARFSLTIDGVEIASFSELAGINTRAKPPTIVLKRGKTNSPELWTWHEAVLMGNMATARKSGSIVAHDYEGKPVARWEFTNAWPSQVDPGRLVTQGNESDLEFLKARTSRGGEVTMETVTIVCEHMQRVSP